MKNETKKTNNVQEVEQTTAIESTYVQDFQQRAGKFMQAVEGFQDIMQVQDIKTEKDATFAVATMSEALLRMEKPLFKIFSKVLFNKILTGEKFVEWAKTVGENRGKSIGKVTAYNYAKVGALLDEKGMYSIFTKVNDCDFSYKQLVLIVDKLVKVNVKTGDYDQKAVNELEKAIEKGYITPLLKDEKIFTERLEKLAKIVKGDDVTDLGNITESESTESENTKRESTESESNENTETIPDISVILPLDILGGLVDYLKECCKLKGFDNDNVKKATTRLAKAYSKATK